jgi:hypothetical protein
MNLEESLVSRILDLDLYSLRLSLAVWISHWTNSMRTEYRSPSWTVDCPLCYSLFHQLPQKKCDNLWAMLWYVVAEMCFTHLLSSNGHLCCASLTVHFQHSSVMSQCHQNLKCKSQETTVVWNYFGHHAIKAAGIESEWFTHYPCPQYLLERRLDGP